MRQTAVDQPIGDVHLVVDRKLDCDDRQRVERRRLDWLGILMPHVKIHKVVAVPAVHRQNAQDKEVTDEDECVRGSHSVSKSGGKTSADYTSVSVDATSTRPFMTVADLQQLLDHVRDGRVAPSEALEQVLQLVNARAFQDLGFARVDHQRELRQGFPEVVFGPGKTPEQIAGDRGRDCRPRATRCWSLAQRKRRSPRSSRSVPDAAFHPLARTITLSAAGCTAGSRNDSGRCRGHVRSAGGRRSLRHRRGHGEHGRSSRSMSASPASIGCSASTPASPRPARSSSSPAWRGRCRA